MCSLKRTKPQGLILEEKEEEALISEEKEERSDWKSASKSNDSRLIMQYLYPQNLEQSL